MSARDQRTGHPATTAVTATAFLVVGAVLLVQQLDLLVIGWTVLVPVLLVALGVFTVLAGVVSARVPRI